MRKIEKLDIPMNFVEQMGIYIKKIAGNLIFPLNVRMELVGSINVEKGDWLNEIRRSGNEVDIAKKSSLEKRFVHGKFQPIWIIFLENKHICTGMGDGEQGNVYFLDEDNVKIYIWNQKYQVYARFGTEGIAELKERIVNSKKDDIQNESKIYYKGMQVTKKNFRLILIFWNIWIFKGHWKRLFKVKSKWIFSKKAMII